MATVKGSSFDTGDRKGMQQRGRAARSPVCSIWSIKSEQWNPSEEEFARALSTLQGEEQERVKRFRFMKDRKRALLGRLLLRGMAKEKSGDSSFQPSFKRTAERKPFIVRGHPTRFLTCST